MRDIKSEKRAIQLIDLSKSCVGHIKLFNRSGMRTFIGRVSMHEENFVTDMFINYVDVSDDFESVSKKVLLMHNIEIG